MNVPFTIYVFFAEWFFSMCFEKSPYFLAFFCSFITPPWFVLYNFFPFLKFWIKLFDHALFAYQVSQTWPGVCPKLHKFLSSTSIRFYRYSFFSFSPYIFLFHGLKYIISYDWILMRLSHYVSNCGEPSVPSYTKHPTILTLVFGQNSVAHA